MSAVGSIPSFSSLDSINRFPALLAYTTPIYHYEIFFLISKNSLKSAEGRNPCTQEVYKGATKKRTETNKKVKNQRTAYYPSHAPTPKDITY
jgi:hypothetical protein